MPWPRPRLASPCALRGLAPQVGAIQFDQIEGAQEHAVIVMAVSQSIEVRDAIVAASDSLTIEDDRART